MQLWPPAAGSLKGTVKLNSLAAFSPPAAAAKLLISSLRFGDTLPQNGWILLNLTVSFFCESTPDVVVRVPIGHATSRSMLKILFG